MAAIGHAGRSIGYAELGAAVGAWSEALRRAGCRPGQALVVLLPNLPVFLAIALACLREELPFVPLDPGARASELAFVLERLSPALVLHLGVRPTGSFACVRLLEGALHPPDLPEVAGHGHPDLQGAAVLQFSSGSTGLPKGIVLGRRAVEARVMNLTEALGLNRSDVTLCSVPLTHSHGLDCLALPTLLAGGRLLLADPAWAIPPAVFETIAEEKVTFFSSVPQFYQLALRLSADRQYDLPSLRLAFCGSAALSGQTAREFERRFGIGMRQGYGLAEIGVITLYTHEPEAHGPEPIYESIGKPIGGIDWRCDDQGQLIVQGEALFSRYFADPAGTAERLVKGELLTQDLVQVDPRGLFFIVGRMNDAIHVAAQKVYPIEIEREASLLPEIVLCAVVGVPDALRGEVPVLHAELAAEHRLSDPDSLGLSILARLRTKLSDFKVPARVVFHEQLPLSPLGKVLRAKL